MFKLLYHSPRPMIISLQVDEKIWLFLLMVFIVTRLVSLYGELYIEHYNNYKFFFLFLSFFISMLILILREGMYALAIGWEYLGLTSLFLIMFYPNKTSFFNRYLTSFFNRLGDVIFVLCIGFYLWEPCQSAYSSLGSHFLLVIIFICAFTKRAQFPFSRWLPAAMSAPTPISAMVHSSTLVTAGVLLYQKFSYFIDSIGINLIIVAVSGATFIIGGYLSNNEYDFKKIVAFSTIRQISLVVLFCSLRLCFISLCHIFFHALFKTLLFCSAGAYLLVMIRRQNSSRFNFFSNRDILVATIIIRLYRISGLPFSSSFYSKDLILEALTYSASTRLFFMTLMGSALTIFYRVKIFKYLYSIGKFSRANTIKSLLIKFIGPFCLITLATGGIVKTLLEMEICPLVTTMEVIFLCSLLFTLTLLKLKNKTSFITFGVDIFTIKTITFDRNLSQLTAPTQILSSIDHFLFKPSIAVTPYKMEVWSLIKRCAPILLFMLVRL